MVWLQNLFPALNKVRCVLWLLKAAVAPPLAARLSSSGQFVL